MTLLGHRQQTLAAVRMQIFCKLRQRHCEPTASVAVVMLGQERIMAVCAVPERHSYGKISLEVEQASPG